MNISGRGRKKKHKETWFNYHSVSEFEKEKKWITHTRMGSKNHIFSWNKHFLMYVIRHLYTCFY